MFDLGTAFSYMFQFLEKKCGDAFPHSLAGDVTFETHAWGHACLSTCWASRSMHALALSVVGAERHCYAQAE
jgi:hypothetical protein